MSTPLTDLTLRSPAPRGLSDVVQTVTGRRPDGVPWMGPALLFNDTAVQTALALPSPGAGEVLLHEYQAVRFSGPFPLDVPVPVTARPGKEVSVTFGAPPVAELRAAFRVASAEVLVQAAPLRARLPGDISLEVTTDAASVETYLTLSGDQNPIHSDQDHANRLGLAAPIVPGILLVSLLQPYVGAAEAVTARFIAPVPVGASLRVAVQRRAKDRVRAMLVRDGAAYVVADVVLKPEPPSVTS